MKDYGDGRSTGLDQTASGQIRTGFVPADVSMSDQDRAVLRRLAEQVAAIAASPKMAETRRLWMRHNRLEKTRPPFFCDPENGWNEIITEAQMECRGKLARRWEMDLRKEIFWGDVLGDDKPVEPYFNVPYTVAPDDWGLTPIYHKTSTSGSYVWDGALANYATDLKHLRAPRVEIDWETTNGCLQIAKDVFGDLLTVRLKGTWWWSLGLTHLAATFRGLQNMLCDFVENPDGLKELLSIISRGHLAKLDYLEANHLLYLNNDGSYVGSGGYGFSDQLPRPDMADHVRPCDMWGFTESQETLHVSPRMYEEFVFPYEKPIMERFGLNCYGCCEPLHVRWNVVKRHPNLRRVSCSPWVNIEKMAEALGNQYIFSMKPNPAALAVPELNVDAIRKELRENLEKTRGCVVEIIMKDNHSLANRPENAVAWCRIAREEVERVRA
jgi:hypothetical protein